MSVDTRIAGLAATPPPDKRGSTLVRGFGRRTLMWGGAALFVLLFLAGAGWLTQHGQQKARQDGIAALEHFVRGAEAVLNRNLLSADRMLASCVDWVAQAHSPATGIDRAALSHLLRAISNQRLFVRDLMVFDAQGRLLAAAQAPTEQQPPPLPPGFADKALGLAVPAMVISAPALSPVTREPVLFLARPLMRPDGTRLLAVAEVPLPVLARLVERSAHHTAMSITLERENGELLATAPRLDTRLGTRLAPPLSVATADGRAREATDRLDPGPALLAVRPTLYGEVLLSTSIPMQAVYAGWYAERRLLWLATAVMVLLMLLAAAIVDGQWRRLLAARAELSSLNAALERQVAERTAAVAEREAMLRVVVDNVPVAISYRDASTRLLFANQRFARAFGHADVSEIIGRPLADVMPASVSGVHLAYSRRATAGESVRYEAPRAADSSRTVEVLLEPNRDSSGQVVGVFAASLDITERKRWSAALARNNAELKRFAEVAAHHLVEPARRLATYTQRLRSALSAWPGAVADEAVGGAMATLEVDARRLMALVRDTQRYLAAAEPRGPVAAVDSQEVFDTVRQAMQASLQSAGAQLAVGALPPVLIDRARLAEVFAVLLDNALSHGRPLDWGQAPSIRVSGEVLEPGPVSLCRFEVSDNGPGIAAEFHERAFGLFERLGTAPAPTGTGAGLALARRIVESCGGRIWIDASTTVGTTVMFELPAAL